MLQYRMPSGVSAIFGTRAIGTGTFGTVYAGTYGEAEVAVKFVQCTRNLRTCLAQEIEILRQLQHLNVVRLIDSVLVESATAVVSVQIMERAVCNLQACIDKKQTLQPRRCAEDIVSACSYVHAHDTVHSDITTMNILLLVDGRFVLSDFGVSCKRGVPRAANTVTNVACRAPECHTDNVADPASDMWSLGCVIAELCCGIPIMFHTALSGAVAHKLAMASTFRVPCVAVCECEFVDFSACGSCWPDAGLYRMVAHCLQARPEARCSAVKAQRLLVVE